MPLHKTVTCCIVFLLLLGTRAWAVDERSTIRLSPQMRELPRDGITQRIPRAELDNFLLPHRMIGEALYQQAPYIVASRSESLILGAGEQIHALGLPPDADGLWGIYRLGQHYRDPDSGESLGQEILRLGTARVLAQEADNVWRLQIRDSQREIQPGDRLLRRDGAALSLYFNLQPAPAHLQGRVVGLFSGQRFAAQYDSVVLNLGLRDGLAEGLVFSVQGGADMRSDPLTGELLALPPHESAQLMVYRVFERGSYAIILSSTHPSTTGDHVIGTQTAP